MGDNLEFQCSANTIQEIMVACLCPYLNVVDTMANHQCLLQQHNSKVYLHKKPTWVYICGCDNCWGCKGGKRWQSEVLIYTEKGEWENILTWDKGCWIPWVFKFTIFFDKTAMVGAHNSIVDIVVEGANNHANVEDYEEVQRHRMVENDAKLAVISNPEWK